MAVKNGHRRARSSGQMRRVRLLEVSGSTDAGGRR